LRVACVGGGPAGLYFALLLKLREPWHDVTVFERSAPGVARGWGVVFWGDLLEKLYSTDPESAREIEQASFGWDKMVVDHEVTAPSQLPECDLIVACDGVNSRIRNETKGFQTNVQLGENKYIWLGTDKIFKAFSFPFVHTDSGWIWAHAYGVGAESSTFIVECPAETWAGLGFDTMPHEDCLAALEKIFERSLDGYQLIGQTSGETNAQWLNFRTVANKHWHDGKIVLAGDAAHTTHFAIGSGTRLAIEDAIALADNLQRHGEVKPALEAYERERRAVLAGPQIAARLSAQWYENVPRYIGLKPRQFATLMRRRRSPLLPHLPPRLAYWLYPTSRDIPALRSLRGWAGPGLIAAYSRLSAITIFRR
jgi:2-polyprenyl-6-methoxyphenol hydroxylase-like FAD-dependent oxidoreductase